MNEEFDQNYPTYSIVYRPHYRNWAVRKKGKRYASKRFDHRWQAILYAFERGNSIIHNEDGSVYKKLAVSRTRRALDNKLGITG